MERAGRIWAVIQDWNDTPGRPHPDKIALSASILEKRFGLFRPTAKAFIETHQPAIDAHNQAHQITAAAHNRSVPDSVWEYLKEQAR